MTDDGVCTHEFLEASNGVVGMLSAFSLFSMRSKWLLTSDEDLLGIGVFSFVRADIESNILVSTMKHVAGLW